MRRMKISANNVKTLAELYAYLGPGRQRIQVTHAAGTGCKKFTIDPKSGSVVCTWPNGQTRTFPCHIYRAFPLFTVWVGLALGFLAIAIATTKFSGYYGPSHVVELSAAFGLWLGVTSCWPRVTPRRHSGMDALASASAIFGPEALYREEGEHHRSTRAGR
jgi:hypothetical protein